MTILWSEGNCEQIDINLKCDMFVNTYQNIHIKSKKYAPCEFMSLFVFNMYDMQIG